MASPRTVGPDVTPISGFVVSETGEQPMPTLPGSTGVFVRAEQPRSPMWVGWVVAALVGTGGGAGLGATVFAPGADPEWMARVELAAAEAEATDAEHARAIAANTAKVEANTAKIATLDREYKEANGRLWAEQIRTTRWMADVLQDQSGALTAIAGKLGVDVDLSLPPLVIGERPEVDP